ncbi:hypothetical protein C8R47DRAFT_1193037 [Mycena vitilis]|nr:hypothetical protein C8R47DRAFT_1193037 [Mycena vitilis]
MFLLPPPRDTDMMDGCPFVLLPDSAENVTAFLKALLHYGRLQHRPLCHLSSLLRMIVLARQLSLTWILPVAFYQACKFVTVEKILTGPMDIADKAACMNACRMSEEPTGCVNPRRCKDSTPEARRDYQRWWEIESEESMVMPLDLWERDDSGTLVVCDDCLTTMKAVMLATERLVWYELPPVFGLPDWDELVKARWDALQ